MPCSLGVTFGPHTKKNPKQGICNNVINTIFKQIGLFRASLLNVSPIESLPVANKWLMTNYHSIRGLHVSSSSLVVMVPLPLPGCHGGGKLGLYIL